MAKPYVIAEAGVNHNGRYDIACKLIDAAKIAGADAVKFQTFKTENILTKKTSMAEYQKKNIGNDLSQYEMIKNLEITFDQFVGLKKYAEQAGIEFLSTPDDEESLDFLVNTLNLSLIKIGSGEIMNLPFLNSIACKQKPIILSTGMSTLGEVEKSVRAIQFINKKKLTLLHCTTNYPCPPEQVNLKAMLTLKQAFGQDVGYSDHTLGAEISVAAVALGATVIEKHLTLDNKLEGPDHAASLDPDQFRDMVRQIRAVHNALGNGIKWPNNSEEQIKPLVRKRVVSANNLKIGHCLTIKDMNFKRSDTGVFVDMHDKLIGLTLKIDIDKDTPLTLDMLK